jgi:hypothetical protein
MSSSTPNSGYINASEEMVEKPLTKGKLLSTPSNRIVIMVKILENEVEKHDNLMDGCHVSMKINNLHAARDLGAIMIEVLNT